MKKLSILIFLVTVFLTYSLVLSADTLPILSNVDKNTYSELSDNDLSDIRTKGSTVHIIDSALMPYNFSLNDSTYGYTNTAQGVLMYSTEAGTGYTLDDGVYAVRANVTASPVNFTINLATNQVIFKDTRYAYAWNNNLYSWGSSAPISGYTQLASIYAGISYMMSPGVYKTSTKEAARIYKLDSTLYVVKPDGSNQTIAPNSTVTVNITSIPNSSGVVNRFIPNSSTPYIP